VQLKRLLRLESLDILDQMDRKLLDLCIRIKLTNIRTQWASLSPEFTGCATNTIQSPIDVTNQSTVAVAGSTLTIEFPDTATAEFENVGTTVEVVMEGKGAKTTIAGKEFELKQFHFHSPSEHTIDGEYFPLEMHMVHEAAGMVELYHEFVHVLMGFQ